VSGWPTLPDALFVDAATNARRMGFAVFGHYVLQESCDDLFQDAGNLAP
jgi:hypothetical protein